MSQNKPQAVTEADFSREVLQSDKLVLVDFWAEWCGPCKMIAPVLEQLAADYGDRVSIRKVDVDANQQLAASYGIRSIPTLMFFKGGEPVETVIGVQPRQRLGELIEARAA